MGGFVLSGDLFAVPAACSWSAPSPAGAGIRQTDVAISYGRETHMYVVTRSYSGQGGSALFDALAERENDVKALLSTVPGFTSYAAFRNDSGGQTVTVCQDKAGTDESSRRAAEWVNENIGVKVDPPTVTEGSAILHF
jgi:hypothetical protein